jgi:ribosomal protein S18 acetylase RimI-like enzyme
MTAFDQAWALLKMPIDVDSYEMDDDILTADFLTRHGQAPHPEGPFKIVANTHTPTSPYITTHIETPKGRVVGSSEVASDDISDIPQEYSSYDRLHAVAPNFIPLNLNVARGFRNRGLGSAMYDAIVEALKRRGMGERLKQSHEVSDDAMRMWGDDTVWPEEGRYA